VLQGAPANLAAIQQAVQRIRQTGIYNVAVVVVEQRILLRPGTTAGVACARAARAAALVQQASQDIGQTGQVNVGRSVIRQRIEGSARNVSSGGFPCMPSHAIG
jgi:hypothetical protein